MGFKNELAPALHSQDRPWKLDIVNLRPSFPTSDLHIIYVDFQGTPKVVNEPGQSPGCIFTFRAASHPPQQIISASLGEE